MGEFMVMCMDCGYDRSYPERAQAEVDAEAHRQTTGHTNVGVAPLQKRVTSQ